ncbi:Zinc/iron permease [Ramaria rubella]|nr:Zinc/iron permease [Ramaria rubella]
MLSSSECPCLEESSGSDNPTTLALRIGAAGIILIVSAAASSFPSLSKRAPRVEPPEVVFFIGKHFGTGVILSTAFVHLLQEGFESLNNPCVPGKWREWSGLFVLVSFFAIFLVEYISIAYVERPSTTHDSHSHIKNTAAHDHPPLIPYRDDPNGFTGIEWQNSFAPQIGHTHHLAPSSSNDRDDENYIPRHSSLPRRSSLPAIGYHRHASPGSRHQKVGPRLAPRQRTLATYIPEHEEQNLSASVTSHTTGSDVAHEVSRKTKLINILVLQVGIMLHSLVIGLTLSITAGANFTTLLAAVVFHQLFEGLSLGIRICSLPSGSDANLYLPVVLCVLFAITAPVGVLLGVEFLPSVDPGTVSLTGERDSGVVQAALLTRGMMCALSAGMLIYAAAVEMIAGDFVMNPEMRRMRVGRQILGLGSLFLGMVAMAVIGIWS